MQKICNTRQQNSNKYFFCIIATICGLITCVFFYLAVIKGRFGGTIYDRLVYIIASILFLLILLYSVKRVFADIIPSISRSTINYRNVIQSICFAIISFITLYYYDSASEYGHRLSMDVITFSFGIILLTLFTTEELMNPITQWATTIVMVLYLDKGLYKHYEDARVIVKFTSEKITLCMVTCVLAVTVVQFINKEKRGKLSAVGVLYTLFMLMIILFSNTRSWPVYTAIPFLLVCFRPVGRQQSLEIIANYARGVVIAFWTMFATAILCRPYYSFEFSRYPGWFSSVASAGLFWIVSFVCALSLLLSKWTRKDMPIIKRVNDCFFELITMGAVLSHLFLSMSRTSILSVVLASIFAFVLVELFRYSDSLVEMGKKVIVIALSLILTFPVCYTMVRCVPAMVSLPYRVSGPEWFSDQIEVGEPWDSTKFMNIAQYGETLLEKVAGIDINLSEMAGAVSGPPIKEMIVNEDADVDQGYGTYEKDGQIYTKKDYTFVNDSEGEESNGRFDILKAYLNNLNLTGHELSQLADENGEFVAYHAHNTYMQVAFDHGVLTGLVFALLTGFAMVVSVVYYKNNGKDNGISIFPALIIFCFGLSGMTEWIFHPSIPLGFGYLMAFVPLYKKEDNN